MKKNEIRNYQIWSIIFTFILGTLLHFTYKWSGENKFVAIFSSINESVWEHLKLLFFPMLLTTIIGYFYFKENTTNFLCSKTLGIIISILFMIIFHYVYSGIIGKTIPLIDISSFYMATILGELLSYMLIINHFKCNNILAIITILILFTSFVVFTYFPPTLGIFKDPITGQYGINKEPLTT